jgi:xylulokinase
VTADDPIVLGLDQGSSGARAVVMAHTGDVLGSGRVACTDLRRVDGRSEHDPAAWLDESFEAARRAVSEAGCTRVDAIGVGALGPAPILLDVDLTPLAPAPLFPIEAEGTWSDHLPAELTDRSVWQVDVAGFLVCELTGAPAMDRITATDHTGGPAARPEPREPFEVAGVLADAAAGRIGLDPGAPVTVGTYDTFIDLAAIGAADPGAAAILLGSTVIVGVVSETPDAPEGLRASPHIGSGWFVGGWTSTAGRALAWAAALGGDRPEPSTARRSAAPGAGGVLALPYLDGERAPVWDPLARGALVGLTTTTTTDDIYDAVLDGVVLSTVDLATRLAHRSVGTPWRVAGGGARDEAWLQATADALGEPLVAIDLPDAGGAARAAFAAIGRPLASPEGRVVEPDPAMHDRWVELAAIYDRLYPALADPIHRLGALAVHA